MPKQYLLAEDIQEIMGVKQATAYKIIKKFNDELNEKGIYTVSGKVSRKYFEERTQYDTSMVCNGAGSS